MIDCFLYDRFIRKQMTVICYILGKDSRKLY